MKRKRLLHNDLLHDPGFARHLLAFHAAHSAGALHEALIGFFRWVGGIQACALAMQPAGSDRPAFMACRLLSDGFLIEEDWDAHFSSIPRDPKRHDPDRPFFLTRDLPLTNLEFEQTPFYKKIFAPHHFRHAVGLNLFHRRKWLGAVILIRSAAQGDFSERELEGFHLLRPTLATAFIRIARIGRERLRHRSLQATINSWQNRILLADAAGDIHYASEAARAWLECQTQPGHLPEKLLRRIADWEESRRPSTASIPLSKNRDGRESETVRIRRLPTARNQLFLIEWESSNRCPQPDPALWEKLLHQLTPAEQRIWPYLIEGQTTKAIAATVERSEATLRKQIRSIMRKAGVKRREGLMSLYRAGSYRDFGKPNLD